MDGRTDGTLEWEEIGSTKNMEEETDMDRSLEETPKTFGALRSGVWNDGTMRR